MNKRDNSRSQYMEAVDWIPALPDGMYITVQDSAYDPEGNRIDYDNSDKPIGLMIQVKESEVDELFRSFKPVKSEGFKLHRHMNDSQRIVGTFPDGVPVDFYALKDSVRDRFLEYIKKYEASSEGDDEDSEEECPACGCECTECPCGVDEGGGCAACDCNNDPSYCSDCCESPCDCVAECSDCGCNCDPCHCDVRKCGDCGCEVEHETPPPAEKEWPELPPDKEDTE